MISKTYVKLVRYFSVLIIVTCLLSVGLFFLTLGKPLASDIHRLLRKQAGYIARLTEELIQQSASLDELNRFLKMTATSYETGIFLFDRNLEPVAGFDAATTGQIALTADMAEMIRASGIYVQSSHGGKPLIYGWLMDDGNGAAPYLLIYKQVSQTGRITVFALGMAGLCILLILAIYPLSRHFTTPLTQLIHAQKQMVAGRFDAAIDVSGRNDEMGDLLNGFLSMQQAMDTMIESRKALLADISHELRSPLSRLNIDVELIRSAAPPPEIAGYIDNIEYEIEYMVSLVKQLSAYSSLSLPGCRMNMERYDICAALADLYGRYQAQAALKGQTLLLQIPKEPVWLTADPVRLTQVFCNLLDNAISFCDPEGEIVLGFSLLDDDLHFFVSNTGPQIPVEIREKIFEPLFRADTSRSRKTGGLGLGLAISRQIVQRHNGRIWCECENHVTWFWFTLKKGDG